MQVHKVTSQSHSKLIFPGHSNCKPTCWISVYKLRSVCSVFRSVSIAQDLVHIQTSILVYEHNILGIEKLGKILL